MALERKLIESSLTTKGFKFGSGDHNFYIYYSISGNKSGVRTKTSHSHRELSDGLVSTMARQCRLTSSDFKDLVNCPLSRAAYEEKLKAQNLV